MSLVAEKVAQAQEILRANNVDCWIVQFAQETELHPDPVQNLLIGTDITWLSAFIIPAKGKPTAIVGSGDVEKIRTVGAYPEIIGYVQGISEPLVRVLAQIDPATIAITTSKSDHAADGLTLGNYQRLKAALRGTPYGRRLISAERIVAQVRGRKLPTEVQRIRAACQLTEELFRAIADRLRPGVTGIVVYELAQQWMRERQLEPAWDPASCPTVPIGPRSPVGHGVVGDIPAQPGDLIFCDVGVVFDGYRSDMQRTWYLAREGEERPPANVQRAWDALMAAVKAGVAKLRPGNVGWQVDAAARREIVKRGFPAPEFAFGHHLGASVHDGAGVLGPRWERYGRAPYFPLEASNVFATEYAIPTSDPFAGWVSVEDDLQVTESGVEWMVAPQREIGFIRT
jgi:Xaa-Pro aminopeptidase